MLETRILLIGSELTEGRIADQNGRFLAAELTDLGFFVRDIQMVPDDKVQLRAVMQEMLASGVALILSSGGLGHTSDDLTAVLWAEVLRDSLVLSEEMLAHLQKQLHARGISSLPYLERYALVPERGKAFVNPIGLAPALCWERDSQMVWALPGPPSELRAIWYASIKPKLQERFPLRPPKQYLVRTTGISESRLSALIDSWEKALPDTFRLAYNPSWEGVTLRLRAPADTETDLILDRVEELRAILRPYIYAEGDISLSEALLQLMKEKGLSLAIAESCTGGALSAEIVKVAGASEVLMGAVVAYANLLKQQLLGVSPYTLETEGAVSEATALQMAEGARKVASADIGLSTTGIAGPAGGSPNKPVGTVWIGLSTPWGASAKKYNFSGDRQTIIQRGVAAALSFLWQNLTRNLYS
ncbi:MAG: CinA family nicotinamide mononucleotide deamidase-related protein [Bacteroidia bacterium]|nr:CinA family nicotinamide mononucleotide deamidase-related protein [Bacteroidia bacterium]